MVFMTDAFDGRPKNKMVKLGSRELELFFRAQDANRDGCLGKSELKEAFRRLGAFLPSWRAVQALRAADENGDGLIATNTEFSKLVNYAEGLGFRNF